MSARSPTSSATFVGRSAELRRLEALLEDGKARNRTIAIVGEAGIGKSRLVEELFSRAATAGYETLRGRCLNVAEGANPFGPFREAFEKLVGPNAFVIETDGSSDQRQRERLFEEVAAAIDQQASRRPSVVAIEDLHWSDQSTRDVLQFLIERGFGRGLLIAMTARREDISVPGPVASFLAKLELSGLCERLVLGPLSETEVSIQVQGILGQAVDDSMTERVWARSSGNPLYVEELVAAASAGRIEELPPTIADAILVRVAELDEHAQQVVRLCAVGGSRIEHSVLRAIAGMGDDELESALRLAIRRQMLGADVDRAGDAYTFRHALVQEALYGDMLPPERTRIHVRYAQALAADPTLLRDSVLRAAEQARHLEAAHQFEAARAAWFEAGRAAHSRLAFPESDAHYRRALSLPVPRAVPDTAEADIRLEASYAAQAVQDHERGIDLVRQAISFTPSDDLERLSLLHAELAVMLWDAGKIAEADQATGETLRIARRLPDSGTKARGLLSHASGELVLGFPERSLESAREAYAVAEAVQDNDQMALALAYIGPSRVCLGEVEVGVENARQGWDLARQSADRDLVDTCGLHYLMSVDLGLGALAAEPIARQLVAEGRARANRELEGSALQVLAAQLFRLGRLAEAEDCLTEARSCVVAAFFTAAVAANQAILMAATGRLPAAQAFMDECAQLMPNSRELNVVLPRHRAEAYLAMINDEPKGVIDAVERGQRAGLPGARDLESGWPLLLLGLRAAGDLAEQSRARRSDTSVSAARSFEGTARRYADVLLAQIPASGPGHQHRAWRSLVEAERNRAIDENDPVAWGLAAEHAAAARLTLDRAYALMRHAEALARDAQRRAEATAAIREAHEIATDVGATALAGQIRQLARRARLPLVAGSATGDGETSAKGDGLSPREREVLALVIAGRSNRQIAEALFVTEKTAAAHVSNILGKLGVGSRGEAAALALRQGLLDR